MVSLRFRGLKRSEYANSRLFFRYLLSYMIVLIVPLLIITVLLYNYFFHVLENEVIKNNTNILDHVRVEMDTRLEEMNKIAFQIYSNPELLTYKLDNNPINERNGIQLLENYIAGSNYIDNVSVYYGQIDKIYSSSRTYAVSDFISQFFPSGTTVQQFHQDMEQAQAITVLPPDRRMKAPTDPGGYYICFVPFGSGSKYDPKMVIFIVQESTIAKMLNNPIGDVLIYDDHNRLIFKDSLVKQQPNLTAIPQNHSAVMNMDGAKYFVTHSLSPETGWTYLIRMPVMQAMHEVIVVKTVFFYVLLFLLVVVMCAGIFATRLQYKPIKQLKQFADIKTGKNWSARNEFEAVRLSIENMSMNNKLLHEKVENNRSAIKEFLLLNLIKGHYANMHQFNNVAKDSGIAFHYPHYCVAVIQPSESSRVAPLHPKDRIEALEEGIPEGLEGYGVDSIDNHIIVIFASPSHDFPLLRETLADYRNKLNEREHMQISVGIGKGCSETAQLGKSYLEACTSLDYRFIKGKNKTLFFEEAIFHAPSISRYPVNELKSLELHMAEGNTEEIHRIVHGIIEQISREEMPLFEARCLSFDIINTVLKTMFIIHREYASIGREPFSVLDLPKFETIRELGDAILEVCSDVCHYIRENKARCTETLISQLIVYIKDNYCNPLFSVQGMADHFNMSMPNLSYYFKRETGQNVTDYINYYRIEKAKELLKATNKTLNEITNEIGYYDTSSFIKKFKKEVGITPGIFRKRVLL